MLTGVQATNLFAQSAETPTPLQRLRIMLLVAASRHAADEYRYTDALRYIEDAIRIAPDDARLYVERGRRWMLVYEWDRGLADFESALTLAPDDPQAIFYRGLLYASVPEGLEARRLAVVDFTRYLEIAPDGTHAVTAVRYLETLQAGIDALTP